MTFTTLTFVVFLAAVFAAYWLVRERRVQNVLLIAVSYVFYGWVDWRLAGLLFATSGVDYIIGRCQGRTQRPGARRALLAVSLTCSLGLFFICQYFDFFAETVQLAAAAVGWTLHPVMLHVGLPLTISFYTFQTMSYAIDVYRHDVKPTGSLIDYLAYMAFFPQVAIGPIERAGSLLTQFARPRRFDYDLARDGCRQILWGFAVKLALADNLTRLVANEIYAYAPKSSGPQLILATVCFAFQIYADFSAYTHIALGAGKLFGIRLTRNFAYPYFSQSVGEFWRRWHMSLSTWLRDYVYIPLGGNRKGRGRQAFNILVTFAVSGLWHAAAFGGKNLRWAFLTWGLLNGMALLPRMLAGRKDGSPSQVPGGEGLLPTPRAAGRMLLTFVFICMTWVFFRAVSHTEACRILWKIVTDCLNGRAWADLWALLAGKHSMSRTLYFLAAFVAVEWFRRGHEHGLVLTSLPRWLRRLSSQIRCRLHALAGWAGAGRLQRRVEARATAWLPPRWCRWTIYTILIWLTLDVAPKEISAFLYGRF